MACLSSAFELVEQRFGLLFLAKLSFVEQSITTND